MDTTALLAVLREAAPGARLSALETTDMPAVAVDRDHLVDVCRVLRDQASLQFALLADLTAVDRLPAEPRYEVVYHLACLGEHYVTGGAARAAAPARLRMKVALPGGDPRLPSVVSVYPTAGWMEREVFDLFGIAFDGHPDLRRILMPDDWSGHPLRKDYPVQIRKDTVAWSPLQLSPEEFARNVRGSRREAARAAAAAEAAGRGD